MLFKLESKHASSVRWPINLPKLLTLQKVLHPTTKQQHPDKDPSSASSPKYTHYSLLEPSAKSTLNILPRLSLLPSCERSLKYIFVEDPLFYTPRQRLQQFRGLLKIQANEPGNLSFELLRASLQNHIAAVFLWALIPNVLLQHICQIASPLSQTFTRS